MVPVLVTLIDLWPVFQSRSSIFRN